MRYNVACLHPFTRYAKMSSLERSSTIFPRSRHSSHHVTLETQSAGLNRTHNADSLASQALRTTHNRFSIPTRTALDHSLCLIRKPLWDIYEGIEYSLNQGSNDWDTILVQRRQQPSKKRDTLYVAKKKNIRLGNHVKTIAKPIHENIVLCTKSSTTTGTYLSSTRRWIYLWNRSSC